MTGYPILGELYVVGTDNKVGTWDGTGVDNRGYLGGWWIQQLTFNSDGTMWCVGTDHNVGKWNGKGWDNQGYPGGWWIHQILFAPDGAMWCVGTDRNVGKWNGKGWDNQGYPGGWWIQQILFAPDGAMWCVGTDHNVGKWNGKGWDNQGYLGGWWIQQLLFDADGIMWCVGTDHNVGKWNGSGWTDLRSIFKGDVTWITWKPHETASAFDNWTAPIANAGLASSLAYGMVWRSAGGTLYGFDHFTGKQTYAISQFGADRSVRAAEPYDDGLLVYASDGYLYKASLTPHAKPTKVAYVDVEPFWTKAYRGSVYLASYTGGLQRVPPASEDFTPASDGRVTFPYGAGSVVGEPTFGNGYLLVPMRSSQVDAVDAASLEWLWRAEVPWGGGYLTTRRAMTTSFNGEYFCVTSDTRAVSVVSVTRRKVAWTKSFAADVGAQVCDLKYCYVSLKSGQLLVLSVADGKLVKTISLPGILDHPIIDDGILYGVLGGDGYNGSLPIETADAAFAADIATGAVAAVNTNSRTSLIGVENGVLYFNSTDEVTASRLGQLARTFYAEATLLQDFDFSGGASDSPKKPLINTEITVFNTDGTPQPVQHVRVGATGPATIECRGETYSVGPSTYASIPTDAAGRLRIGIRAGEADKQNQVRDGLTCPGLTLFTTFMGANHRILIRPDAQLHDKLANMEDNGLATARDYEGRPILRDTYQGDSKQNAVVSATKMIKSTVSMVQTSVDHRNRRRTTRDDYLAPGCDTEVICCCHDKDYAVPVVCASNFAFDLDQATFKDRLDERQTQEWLATLQMTGQAKRGLDDYLWEAIKNGTAAITSAIIYAEKQAKKAVKAFVIAVIDGAKQVFDLVLETIEQAVTVVHGIFNQIAESIGKVLQALSFAFSWPAIVVLKDQIKGKINDGWNAVLEAPKGQPSQYDLAATASLAAIDAFRGMADQAFKQIKDRFSEKSVAQQRTQAVGDKNPAAGGSTGNWLQAKLGDNLLSERALPRPGAQTRAAAMPDIPTFDMPDGVIEELQGLIPRLAKIVTPDVAAHLRRIGDDLAPGSGLNVFTAAASAIIEVIRGVVDIAIELAREGLATLLKIIKCVLKAAREFADKTIKIPFISEFYERFVGGPLTILDLSALLVAVPLSLVIAATKLKDRHAELTPRALTGLSPRDTAFVVGAATGTAQVIWAGFSTAFELFNLYAEKRPTSDKGLTRVVLTINLFLLAIPLVTVRGLSLASEILAAPENRDHGQPDWIRVMRLWGPATMTAAIDFGAAAVKAWVLEAEDSGSYEGLEKTMAAVSVGGGAFFGLIDIVTAAVTIKFKGPADFLEFFAHLSEDVALGVRIPSLVIRNEPGAEQWEVGLIAATFGLLAAAGILKFASSLIPPPPDEERQISV